MVIFGAAGDLTKRLLVPALYNLATTKLLPEYFELIGVDLADLDTNAWRDSLHKMMESFVGHAASESRIDKVDEDTWKRLTNHITYIKGDLNDDGLYGKLKQHLDQESGSSRQLFVLSGHSRPIFRSGGHSPRQGGVVRGKLGSGWQETRALAPRGDRKAVRPR